jgi:hypothetical protein
MRIVRPDGTIIEGTAQELAAFEAALKFSIPENRPVVSSTGSKPREGGEGGSVPDFRFVQSDVALRALTRIRLSKEQALVLVELYNAGDKWVQASVLQSAIGYKPSQFAGLMGAFGRRVAYTPGYVAYSAFFEQEWDANSACYRYRLPESVREALRLAKLV